MKKSELTNLITRKTTLKESLDIVKESISSMDEIGGFDNPELMSQYHGNYTGDLITIFHHFDGAIDLLMQSMESIVDENERAQGKEVLNSLHDFMKKYLSLLANLSSKSEEMDRKYPQKDSKITGLNDPINHMKGFSLNERKKR